VATGLAPDGWVAAPRARRNCADALAAPDPTATLSRKAMTSCPALSWPRSSCRRWRWQRGSPWSTGRTSTRRPLAPAAVAGRAARSSAARSAVPAAASSCRCPVRGLMPLPGQRPAEAENDQVPGDAARKPQTGQPGLADRELFSGRLVTAHTAATTRSRPRGYTPCRTRRPRCTCRDSGRRRSASRPGSRRRLCQHSAATAARRLPDAAGRPARRGACPGREECVPLNAGVSRG
jgi:hypothetical protein